jgi:hypothetical protein
VRFRPPDAVGEEFGTPAGQHNSSFLVAQIEIIRKLFDEIPIQVLFLVLVKGQQGAHQGLKIGNCHNHSLLS